MGYISKVQTQIIIIILWGLYILYIALFGRLLFFPKDSIELIIAAMLQILIFLLFNKLLKEKYSIITKLTAITCCILVILWHFNENYGASIKMVMMLFNAAPIILTLVAYLTKKINKLLIIRSFGVSLLLTFINFMIAVFTFYIFHYWI
jgi:hypothetical protein